MTKQPVMPSKSPKKAAGGPRGKAATKQQNRVQSLALGLSVLEVFAKSSAQRGITELSNELGLSKWRLFRHLNTLCDEGYLLQDPVTKKFARGPRLNLFKNHPTDSPDVVDVAHAEMELLQRETALSVLLSGRGTDNGVTIIACLAGTQNFQLSLEVGTMLDLHSSAHGKVALAFSGSPPDGLRISRDLNRRTECTITNRAALLKEIEKVRKQGWASAPEETFQGVNSVVAPVFSINEQFAGGLGIMGAIGQIPARPSPALVRKVVEAARRLSRQLGSVA
jgi:IclR family transcriptional regulator, KDG regulon repressor